MGMFSKTKEGEEAPPKPKTVAYHKLFKYASCQDITFFLLGLFGAVVQGISQVYMIVVFGDIMDEIFLSNDDETLEMVRMFMYIGIVAFFSGWMQFTFTNLSMEAQKQKLRLAYLTAVVHQDVAWFDTHQAGSLPESISANIEKIALGLGDKVGNLVMDVSMLVTGLTLGLCYWWKMTLLVIAIVPLMAVGAGVMAQAMTDIQNENQTWYGKAGACCEEVMRALRTVVAFRGEQLECDRYDALLAEAKKGGVRAQLKVGIGMGYTMAIMFGAYGLAFWFGAYLMKNGETKADGDMFMAGDVMKTFFCVLFGGFALGLMGEPIQAVSTACASGAALYDVLDSKPKIEAVAGTDPGEKISGISNIEFKDVEFTYPARPDTQILNGTSLKINAGQKVALVGESGSGKSTIISLIERFYDASAGQVLINGVDIKTLSTKSLRSVIGYVGQEPVLFATSIRTNIMYGNPNATPQELEVVQKRAQLDFISTIDAGLDTFVGSGGSQFSGGQKQRIALARALIKKPSLLLLDEATSALDNKSEKMVQETLDKLGSESADSSLTTIEIAHRLSTVINRDVIFVMQKGVVVESGPHKELMEKKGTYYALVASQGAAENEETGSAAVDNTGVDSSNIPSMTLNAAQEKQTSKLVVDADKLEEERKAEILKEYKTPMFRILGFCRPEWIWIIPGVIGALLFGAKEPVLGYVLFEAIALFYNPNLNQMYDDVCEKCWWFLWIAIACQVGGILQYASFGVMKEGLTMRMRAATLKKLLRMEVGYHDDPNHTPSKNVFALETYAFRCGNMMLALGAYANVFGALFIGVGIGFLRSWRMSLMMFGMMPVMAIANYIGMMMTMTGQQGTSEELKTAQQVVSDSVNSIRTVRALGVEDILVELVNKWSTPVTQRGLKKAFLGGGNFGLSQGLVFFVFGFAFWWAMWLIRHEYNTFTEAMQAMGCILFGAMGMGSAMSLVGNASQATVACHDLFVLLDRPSQIDGIEPTGETPAGEVDAVGRIEFKDVKFFYPFRQDVQVLNGITFSVTEGQSVGLCGPSGGGKSTILALLQRFYDPQAGEIFITDRHLPLNKVNIAWWRAQMGYIGQEPILFDTTVRENVLYGMDASKVSKEHLEKCGDMACLDFLKEQDGWETQVGPRGERLSGGQKQRVAICRAIVRDPQILLLDEATSALDSKSEEVVQRALNNVLVARTSFTIAHRLSTIEKCDVILACAEGTIVEAGTHSELMALGGVYQKLQAASKQ